MFGLRLFTKLASFDTVSPACTAKTVQSFLGYDVHIQTGNLKRFWIVAYATTLVPVLNMFPSGFAIATWTFTFIFAGVIVSTVVAILVAITWYLVKEDPRKSISKFFAIDGNTIDESVMNRWRFLIRLGGVIAMSCYMVPTLLLDIVIVV